VGERVRRRVIRARKAAGLSRKEVADALSITENTYGHYERGRTPFTIEQLFVLSRVLGHPVEYFLDLTPGLSEEENHLVALYRSLEPPGQRWLMELAETTARTQREMEQEQEQGQ